jgi:hypothetical protein
MHLKNKNRGFAHPLIFFLFIFVVATAATIYFYNRNVDTIFGSSPQVAGVSVPNYQIAAIPKAECDIFIATNGNDSNNGRSEGAAFKTINKGVQLAQPGDSVCIKGGTYRQTVVVKKKGTASAPIKIGGYTGAGLPNITGGIANGDEYMLPDPQCKVKDGCVGDTVSGGRCEGRASGCIYDKLFDVNESDHIQLIGFDVSGSSGRGLHVGESNDIYVKGVRSYHNWNAGFNISNSGPTTRGQRNHFEMIASFDNIRALPEKGLVGGGSIHVHHITGGSIKDSLVFENFGEGLDVGKSAANINIERNVFWDNYHTSLYANASEDATFNRNFLFCTGNRVKWLEQSGVSPGSETGYGSAITVRNEKGVVSKFGSGHGTIVSNNTITGCTNAVIVAAQGTVVLRNVKVLNNTIVSPRDFPSGGKYNGKDGTGITIQKQSPTGLEDIEISNNVILAEPNGDSIKGGAMTDSNVRYKNNIVSKAPQANRPGITVADPKIAKSVGATEILNPATITPVNYVITTGSPAIGGGAAIADSRGLLEKDLFNNARSGTIDAGSYKFNGSKNWTNIQQAIIFGEGGDTEPPTPPVNTDPDGDGVPNDGTDQCPNRAAGPTPDPQRPGCPLATEPTDPDGDGVPNDGTDKCPTVPAGPTPDPQMPGCPKAEDPEDPVETNNLTKNPGFTQEAEPNSGEFAKFWVGFKGKLGEAVFNRVTVADDTLAAGQAARLRIVTNPIVGYPSISQKGVDMDPETTYKVSFVARSSNAAEIIMTFRDMGYIQESLAPTVKFDVGTGWKLYEADVTTTRYSADKAAQIFIGYRAKDGSVLTIDRVRIVKK